MVDEKDEARTRWPPAALVIFSQTSSSSSCYCFVFLLPLKKYRSSSIPWELSACVHEKLSERKIIFWFHFRLLLSIPFLSFRECCQSLCVVDLVLVAQLQPRLWCVCYFIQFIHSLMLACVWLCFSSCCTHFGLPLMLLRLSAFCSSRL